ncbi:SMP-30/gluconolactonase/LRE family protein [Sphingobacterium hotanense]|uniref:SMP-30/gluconolactonase/LRE family protein n=1 Tax=Sphingobacterium hotanense TaxID=649196 RepID=UPI0021A45061|nr:ATP-binding protein [Sphingobacterium hotanense]MCT1526140.1 ATP-binding protein [Sphingobacterium hotanense]
MMKYALSLALIFSLCTAFGQKKLTQLWESKEQLPVPESVLYVPERSELFVTLIDGDGSTADGKGGVAILNLDGSMKNATWVQGLNAPKGMALYKDQLYIADINEVVVVDIITGNVINQIKIPDSKFLNDVAVDRAGKVYVSDTRDAKIYQLHNNRPTLFMSDVPNVNGLRVIDGSLYAMAGPELWKIDGKANKTVIAKGLKLGGDGLEPVGDGSFLVTCWGGLIYHITAQGQVTELLDVQGKMNTADLGYNPKDRILYVPTFNSNSVVAYQLD